MTQPDDSYLLDPPHSIILLVGRMDAKLDLLLARDVKQDDRIGKTEDRISALENWRSQALGVLAAISAVVAVAVAWITTTIAHYWR